MKSDGAAVRAEKPEKMVAEMQTLELIDQMLLLMYFMREPFYSMLTGRVAKSVLGTFAKIPLVGFFFEYFLEMLEYMKRYYFFWSGS